MSDNEYNYEDGSDGEFTEEEIGDDDYNDDDNITDDVFEGVDRGNKSHSVDQKDEDDEDLPEYEYVGYKSRKVASLKTEPHKVTEYERIAIISQLANDLNDSKISVPRGTEEALNIKSGDVIEIATLWWKNRREFPIPMNCKRSAKGTKAQIIDPNTLVSSSELDFEDLGW